MKKVISYILLVVMMASFLPYQALAQTSEVGVNITGSVSIDVITTISADITLDLTTGETTPTYMEIKNQSEVPVSAKITNISTTSTGAPSTFVGTYQKDWSNLSKEETRTYVNFNILGEGQSVTAQDILANTELDLGTLAGFNGNEYYLSNRPLVHYYSDSYAFFEISANFGKNWDSGDKNFTYQIETVYSQADEHLQKQYTLPEVVTSSNVKLNRTFIDYDVNNLLNLQLDCYPDYDENNIDLSPINVFINDTLSSYSGIHFAGAEVGSDGNPIVTSVYAGYSMPTLESSAEGTTHYLNIKVVIDDQTYAFIEKVVMYSE